MDLWLILVGLYLSVLLRRNNNTPDVHLNIKTEAIYLLQRARKISANPQKNAEYWPD